MCRPKYVEHLRNIRIINYTTALQLVGSFFEIYIAMHGSMNIKDKNRFRLFFYHSGKTIQLQWGRKLAPTCEKIQNPINVLVQAI
jgi:hypothetical protein